MGVLVEVMDMIESAAQHWFDGIEDDYYELLENAEKAAKYVRYLT